MTQDDVKTVQQNAAGVWGVPRFPDRCHCEERADEAISGWGDEDRLTHRLPRLLLVGYGEWLAVTGWG